MFNIIYNIISYLILKGFFNWMPDSLYLKIIFRIKVGYPLNLKNPRTFNEKMQWLKIHDRKTIYSQLADKYEVRKFITEKIGDKYLIPLLGVWNNANEIDFDKLPNQFVLKCTHDSKSVMFCYDKNTFDFESAKRKLKKCLKRNFFSYGREWSYKHIVPRIIAEKYIIDCYGQMRDYKIFCFNGKPKYIQVDYDRFIDHKRNIFDENWNVLDLEIRYPNEKTERKQKIQLLNEMLEIAKILSANIPFVRLDFYHIENNDLNTFNIFFGEITFYPNAGFDKFKPERWDKIFGDLIKLEN